MEFRSCWPTALAESRSTVKWCVRSGAAGLGSMAELTQYLRGSRPSARVRAGTSRALMTEPMFAEPAT